MNKIEAKEILAEQIKQLRILPYSELCKLIDKKNQRNLEIVGKSGTKYQVEIQAFWDDKPGQDVRVSVAIDDGAWRAFFPITDDFIL
ncbi:MAG: hypothetical protein ACRECJ_08055 [Limisphaerales bacterium]